MVKDFTQFNIYLSLLLGIESQFVIDFMVIYYELINEKFYHIFAKIFGVTFEIKAEIALNIELAQQALNVPVKSVKINHKTETIQIKNWYNSEMFLLNNIFYLREQIIVKTILLPEYVV